MLLAFPSDDKPQWHPTLGCKVITPTGKLATVMGKRLDGKVDLLYAGWRPHDGMVALHPKLLRPAKEK